MSLTKKEEESWFFIDKEQNIQGPYSYTIMRKWYTEGFLKDDLEISHSPTSAFHTLREFYPNVSRAFDYHVSRPQSYDVKSTTGASTVLSKSDQGEEIWYFLGNDNDVQGPFTAKKMLKWFKMGYFDANLQIYDKSRPRDIWGWRTLKEYYPNYVVETPFVDTHNSQSSYQQPRKFGRKKEDPRLSFPKKLPLPPPFEGVDKIYPGEHPEVAIPISTVDIFGNRV
eukprot:snap_masked-scaffold_18-processed-gene-5.25-mRNA-1 protein AED:1.00 eAED:1.00 QI:0/-1/0/0/-1/1/1/0/224